MQIQAGPAAELYYKHICTEGAGAGAGVRLHSLETNVRYLCIIDLCHRALSSAFSAYVSYLKLETNLREIEVSHSMGSTAVDWMVK